MSEDTPQTEDPMVAALLRERAGYAGRKGMEDRVAAVDGQLRLHGYTPQGERPADGATPSVPPRGRRARTPDKA